jgi:tRNA nucleotidyltransferase (CCA-adding enzyme)
VRPPLRAEDIMSQPVRVAGAGWTMRRAGELMATWGHGGLPVVENGTLIGLVTRKDVDKAARHGLDHAPVTGFMSRDVLTVGPEATLVDLESVLATRGVGRLPVLDGAGRVIGIVTRKDVLRAEHGDIYLAGRVASAHPRATDRFRKSVQDLLPPDVSEALRTVGAHAARHGSRAYVVGGFVRDMLLGVKNLDIDVVVEGDGVEFAETLGRELGVHVRVHRRFGTAVVAFSERFHIDIASARTEYYAKPGALPTVERSSLRQDLFRRDFTINAMAACLEPGCFGAVSDPFGGLRDLDAGVIRVLHGLSFVDDPTRVMRAVRFESRYGFGMDSGTEGLAERAIEMGMLAEVSGARVREELLDILAEERPWRALTRLQELGALSAMLPRGADPAGIPAAVRAAEEAREALQERHPGFSARRDALLVAVIAASGARRMAPVWLRHLHVRRDLAAIALDLAEHRAKVDRALASLRGLKDSRLYRLLSPLTPETLAALWARGDELARERIDRYLSELADVRLAVGGADLIQMGAAPGEGFSAILARALDDRLDGRAVGRAQELANLRRLAMKAGLFGQGKEPA